MAVNTRVVLENKSDGYLATADNIAYTVDSGVMTKSVATAISEATYDQSSMTSTLGMGSLNNSTTWGTTTSTNGYTVRWGSDQPSGGGFVVSEKDGKTYIQINGDYYANEGANRVAYTSEIPTNTNQLTNGSRFITTAIAGNYKIFFGYRTVSGDSFSSISLSTFTYIDSVYASQGRNSTAGYGGAIAYKSGTTVYVGNDYTGSQTIYYLVIGY